MIETALYSFWSKPYKEKNSFKTFGEFNNKYDFILSWSTSVRLSKENFKKVVLVTDTWAWNNIFKNLNLPFDEVKLSLDKIDHSTTIWSISKAYSILEINDPFLHIDSDVYIWKKLPDEFLDVSVLVQDSEGIHNRDQYILYLGLEWDYKKYLNGKNKYLDNSNLKDKDIHAWNTGIVGGNNIDFLHNWANEFIKISNLYDLIISSEEYQTPYLVCFIEQTLIMLMSEYHSIKVTPILSSRNEEQDLYTHLMSSSKRDREMMRLLANKHQGLFGELDLVEFSI
jgi:hypothetical protein